MHRFFYCVSSRWQRMAALTPAAALVVLAACAVDGPVEAHTQVPGGSAVPAQFRGAAFILDVSTVKKTVKVSAPTAGFAPSVGTANMTWRADGGPQLSLLGADVIDITVSNYIAGAIGAAVPGKALITFDLTLNNKLVGIGLTTPSFPTPPSGVTGVQAFPFELSVLTSAGGVSVNGGEIRISSPRSGVAVPSGNWDGAPHNFFNDVGCTATSNDCFRYEPFGIIAPQSSSATRQVGFLVDPTVGDLRVRLILAADLQPMTTPTPGTVSGSVTAP